jgi:hypothetical protein
LKHRDKRVQGVSGVPNGGRPQVTPAISVFGALHVYDLVKIFIGLCSATLRQRKRALPSVIRV